MTAQNKNTEKNFLHPGRSKYLSLQHLSQLLLLVLLLSNSCLGIVAGAFYKKDLKLSSRTTTTPYTICGEPSHLKIPCFDDRVKTKLVYSVNEPIHIKCIIHNADSKAVTWTKDGLDMPISIGTTRFLPDPRIMVDHTRPEEWNLVIARARSADAGVYRCQINLAKLKEKAFNVFITERGGRRRGAEGNLQNYLGGKTSGDRKQSDEPNSSQVGFVDGVKPRVKVTGADTVLLGSRDVSLKCVARYMTKDAKINSMASVQWYHMGIELFSSAREGLDISMSWQDGDILVSLLVISKINVKHAGRWTCVKRPSEIPGKLEAAYHDLNVLGRKRYRPQINKPKTAAAAAQNSENSASIQRTNRLWIVSLSLSTLLVLIHMRCLTLPDVT